VEHFVANALGEGLDKLIECFQACESKYANSEYHEAWLCAFKQAILGDDLVDQHPQMHLMQKL